MEHSGFFNARLVDGQYDRLYNAEDYRGNLGAIISNGVRRSDENDLKVTALEGSLDVIVNTGRAWINGAWYYNDEKVSFTLDAPNATRKRIDRIILRFDNSRDVRSVNLRYAVGTAGDSPVPPAPIRSGDIYELVLADISIASQQDGFSTIKQTDITDQRPNGKKNFIQNEQNEWVQVDGDDLCGWITTPVGYEGFFESIDQVMYDHLAEIDAEWQSMKDRWASSTLFRKYEARHVIEAGQETRIEVPIVQFNPEYDILEVFVNGIYSYEGDDYALEGNVVVFTVPKIIGTDIAFSVYKSIDGSGNVDSFMDLLTEVQNQVSELNNIKEYRYFSTGVDDNIKLSEICNSFFNGTDDGNEIKINIYGDNFVCTTPYSGEGSQINRYKWISVSPTGSTSRKITLDFSNCSKIVIPVVAGSYNIVFLGKDMTIIGASVEANNTDTNTSIIAFNSTNGNIKAVRCRFNLTGYHRTFIAENGTFDDCIGTCSVISGEGYCFYTNAEGLLRIMCGEYKAYTQASLTNSMVVKQIDAGAGVIMYGVNCPVVAKSGFRQTHAINATGGQAVARDLITTLTVTAGTVNGTISYNKPDRG